MHFFDKQVHYGKLLKGIISLGFVAGRAEEKLCFAEYSGSIKI